MIIRPVLSIDIGFVKWGDIFLRYMKLHSMNIFLSFACYLPSNFLDSWRKFVWIESKERKPQNIVDAVILFL